MRHGQIALEFLIMFGAVLVLFIIAFVLYANNIAVAEEMNDELAATKLCLEVSSIISSVSSMGGDSEYEFDFPPHLNYKNYSIWVVSDERLVIVDYEIGGKKEPGASCRLQTTGVTNSMGESFFRIDEGARIVNERGIVYVE